MQDKPTILPLMDTPNLADPRDRATGATTARPATLARWRPPLLLYGIYLMILGLAMYFIGVLAVFPRYLTAFGATLTSASEFLVWYSGVPLMLGLALMMFDLLVLFERKRSSDVRYRSVDGRKVTVVLTAYNDEMSIGSAVQDFAAHPRVSRVIVVSNNSADRTFEKAKAEGAIVFNETQPGYGHCVHRCLREALLHDDADLVVLSEGDCTFRAYDIDKLLAYAPHADIVNGTRTVEMLRQRQTQLTTFMFYGNLFVGKLLEAKHLGRGTITDVGTTYKLCWRDSLDQLLPALDPAVNLEFNAHLLDRALGLGLVVVECPITFHPRVGLSKGGNTHNLRALAVGLRMMRGLTFGWSQPG